MARLLIALASLMAMSSCQSTGHQSIEKLDAIIINPSEITRAELGQTISNALNGRRVTIAPDSFTQSSIAIIERRQMMGPDGNPIMGRDFGKPDHFILKTSDQGCWLYHRQSEEYYALKTVKCKTLNGKSAE